MLRSCALASLVALVPSCAIRDIDISDRRCPCVEGWVCDTAIDRCVRASDDGGAADAPRDAVVDLDAGPIDAGPPPPFCETVPDAIFCEDFEGVADWRARWKRLVDAEGGRMDPLAASARSGERGLLIYAPASAITATLTASIDTAATSALYFRASVRVAAASTAPIDLFALTAGESGSVSAQMIPSRTSFRVATVDGSDVHSDEGRSGAWQLGSWECVTAVVQRSSFGRVRIDASGPRAAELAPVDTDLGAPFDAFSITIGSDGAELELDDVAWTRAPLPCPP